MVFLKTIFLLGQKKLIARAGVSTTPRFSFFLVSMNPHLNAVKKSFYNRKLPSGRVSGKHSKHGKFCHPHARQIFFPPTRALVSKSSTLKDASCGLEQVLHATC
ncbi:hypothetical protein CEXT_764391 [Caerostris extrusa]|uniref:Uncharacterized protein n=1 Tax=Caerostris extrusa TaxID=172846 RepID=A0AAV4MP28_CAEEX|nr:hypothetical protein CEXT_764391 [Caerostris extrusa]